MLIHHLCSADLFHIRNNLQVCKLGFKSLLLSLWLLVF